MNKNFFTVKLDTDSNLVICDTVNDVYDLLKKKKLISVLRYNDNKTGRAYAKAAASQDLTVEEQEQTPVFIKLIFSGEGMFVKDEAFWIENYMLGEFYNPEQLPYIEEMIRPNGEISG